MNETTLGCQPIAGQRQLPQACEETVAGMEARSGQPVLRALAPQQNKVAAALLDRPLISAHEAQAPSQFGPDNVASAPRFAPPKAESAPDSPPPRWLAKLSPNARDKKCLGAAGGLDESIIQTMLTSKLVDVNAKNENGDTGLHLAVQEGDPDIIRLFLGSARIDINARNAHGRTPLHLAVIDYAYESVFDLVGCDRTDVNAEDKEGWTALRWAARHGRESLVKVLLTAPAIAVNAADARGWTALRHAAEGRHVKVVRMLLSHPCIRIHPRSQDDWNILQWAFDSNLCDLVLELIRSHGAQPELGTKKPRHVFLLAAEQGKTEMVRSLLSLPGLDVNMVASEEVDSHGDFSPLVLAAMNGHLDTVQALLEAPDTDLNFGYARSGTRTALRAPACDAAAGFVHRARKCQQGADRRRTRPRQPDTARRQVFIAVACGDSPCRCDGAGLCHGPLPLPGG
jgi:ankyrin repeat protein